MSIKRLLIKNFLTQWAIEEKNRRFINKNWKIIILNQVWKICPSNYVIDQKIRSFQKIEVFNKIVNKKPRVGSYAILTKRVLCVTSLYIKTRPKTRWKWNIAQFFLACLLRLLAGQPCFYFIHTTVSLMIGWTIRIVILITPKIAINLSQ